MTKLHQGTKIKLSVPPSLYYRYSHILIWKKKMEWKGHLMKVKGLIKMSVLKFIKNSNRSLHNICLHIFQKKCSGFIQNILQQTGAKHDFVAFVESWINQYFHWNACILHFHCPFFKELDTLFQSSSVFFLKLVLFCCGFAIWELFENSETMCFCIVPLTWNIFK